MYIELSQNEYEDIINVAKSGANIADDIDTYLEDLQLLEHDGMFNISDYISDDEIATLEAAYDILREAYMSVKTDYGQDFD